MPSASFGDGVEADVDVVKGAISAGAGGEDAGDGPGDIGVGMASK